MQYIVFSELDWAEIVTLIIDQMKHRTEGHEMPIFLKVWGGIDAI